MPETDTAVDSLPDQMDLKIGERLRRLRAQQQVTQKTLGDACGVSFQQIQKYERGISRIPAGNLLKLAQALKIPISAFFDNGDDQTPVIPPAAQQLLEAFESIPSAVHRRMVLRIVEDLAQTLKGG